jgi:xylulokinase
MMKALLLGVDLGTMGTKGVLIDEEGCVLAEAYKEVALRYPRPGWVEQDLEEIYASALEVIQACLAQSQVDPSRVQAIAFDGQMSGLGAVDSEGRPAIPFDSWLDTRCTPYIGLLKNHEEEIIRHSGGPPSYSHGAKILWWMQEAPETFRKISKFLVPAGYVALRMAGLRGEDAFIDWTYIHFSVFSDLPKKSWNLDLIHAYRIPEEKFPRIVDPWSVVGGLSKEAAQILGLRQGTPIVAGCGDQAATMLGAGVVRPGLVLNVLGTASVFAATTASYTPDTQEKTFFTARLPFENLYYQIAFINGGGLNLRWFRDEILSSEKEKLGQDFYAFYSELAGKVPPGSQGLLFVPHLGGRVTPSVPHLRGALLGLNWGHSRAHLYRALLEGVAYEFALYMSQLTRKGQTYGEARAIGGGARSATWVQILADVLGLPYVRLQREEFAAYGSALLAGHGIGLFSDLAATAERFTEVKDRFLPREEIHNAYLPLVDLYRRVLEAVEDFSYQLLEFASGGRDDGKGSGHG